MLNRFTELINQNIAPANYKVNTFNDGLNSKNDALCRLYNNVWGALTDTCMTLHDDGSYVITGSMIRNKDMFTQFVGAMTWGMNSFRQATKYDSLQVLFDAFGLEGKFGTQNGDDVYVITKKS